MSGGKVIPSALATSWFKTMLLHRDFLERDVARLLAAQDARAAFTIPSKP